MAGMRLTAGDCREALRRVRAGLAQGDDVFGLAVSFAALHRMGDTFPGEVFLCLAADALDCAGAGSCHVRRCHLTNSIEPARRSSGFISR
jgi:hypothetical protein